MRSQPENPTPQGEAQRLLGQAIDYICRVAQREQWSLEEAAARRARPEASRWETAMDAACKVGDVEALKQAARAWWQALGVGGGVDGSRGQG